jgi:hypothetical protein
MYSIHFVYIVHKYSVSITASLINTPTIMVFRKAVPFYCEILKKRRSKLCEERFGFYMKGGCTLVPVLLQKFKE